MPPPLLRSKANHSDSALQARLIADQALIASQIGPDEQMHVMRGGKAMVMRAAHPAFEGSFETGPYLRVGLCTGPSVRIVQHSGRTRLEGLWRSGTVVVGPGDGQGLARCGNTRMIGLMIAPGATPLTNDPDPEQLEILASGIHQDTLLASLLVTLCEAAEVHGASTAFFEHGVALVLRRLAELDRPAARRKIGHPLDDARFALVEAFIKERLGNDVLVAEMADVAGMEPSTFSKALSARTGCAPYAWLTRCRMEEATERLSAGWSVIRTANSLGYTNPAKFADAFRRVTGCLPSRWVKD